MTRVQMTQAVAADYADAMLVARRAKNVLFYFLILVLLIQLGVFFTVRFVPGVKIRGPVATTVVSVTPAAATGSASTAAAPTTAPTTAPASASSQWLAALPTEYLIAGTDFLGVILSIVLAAILMLIITIMLVGRLIGVSHVTGAFCWAVVLIVMLFPWQSLLNGKPTHPADSTNTTAGNEPSDLKVPGVLYTFTELVRDYDFPSNELGIAIPKWLRFVGFPALAIIILLMVQGRSSRGLRFALGEAEVTVETPRT